MQMVAKDTKADANPTKAFFVLMITRDITLEDCILDLIDNSLDGAWRQQGSQPAGLDDGVDLSRYHIHIEASPQQFSIRDNCGGMTLDDAANHAFSFGRKVLSGDSDYSIGVYGIGMKRAVFKLGADIRVRSTYGNGEGRHAFAVPIRVADWIQNDEPPWDFDLVSDELLEEDGVEITVQSLTSGAENSFDSPAFIQNLRRTIARDYSLHLNRGLKVFVNGVEIRGWNIELRQSDNFQPMRLQYEDQIGGDAVSVEIISGMAAPPPDSSDPDERNDGDLRFGWYAVCNQRIVLAADKTSVSGWGTEEWPQWHRQYSGFIGIVLFTARKAAALPLTTTKRSVDTSSEIYRRAHPRMRDATRRWIEYTNLRKQALEEAKAKEAEATPVPIQSVRRLTTATLPVLVAKPIARSASVSYSVPATKLRKLAKELGSINLSNREVGLRSFDYTYTDLVGEE